MSYHSPAAAMRAVNAVAKTNWCWCAVDHSSKRVFFTMWDDLQYGHSHTYVIQEPHWGVDDRDVDHAQMVVYRKDQDDKLRLVFDEGYTPYGYFITALNPRADLAYRQRAVRQYSSYFDIDVERLEDGTVVGTLGERHRF